MKKIIGLLLVIAVVFSTLAITAVAEAPVKEFVIDGVLDPWYLTNETTPADDINTYHMQWFDPYVKGGAGTGSSPFEEPETKAEAWTAYDDNYVYFYVKVWDDDLRFWKKFEPDDYSWSDSSEGDSVEFWFDPDPDSVNKFNFNDPTADPVENGKKFYICNNTRDERQGDIHMRMQALLNPDDGNIKIDDYHDYIDVKDENGNNVLDENGNKIRQPIYRPGYNGLRFGEYIHNVDNICHFTFENEPVIVDEYSGKEVSSGYGVEVRFPRNDDETNSYYFNIAINNSSIYKDQRYALALGSAWWTSYTSGMTVEYQEVNPFFAQDIGGEPEPGPGPEPGPEPQPTVTLGDLNGDTKVDAKDALNVLKISVNKLNPTEEQKIAADVNKDNNINAKDALEILKKSVGKEACF